MEDLDLTDWPALDYATAETVEQAEAAALRMCARYPGMSPKERARRARKELKGFVRLARREAGAQAFDEPEEKETERDGR